ncbi:Uncharacterised protein [Kingella potus]|uniref:Knr4/Smi1-like domain-containing protein n=1 Tax=Kingella potus TaxID=265175 RepID=A0A377R3L1_9NEIS|nr:SMI1/KNR4 family protein [Kingella potus]UOP00373.1 SMI1/KNR4 family protein [Kingella potus]STR02562.1 Uncharacterised protein [Kingella potus]
MNAAALKSRLDSLFARLNPPYGVVPEWHEAAASEAEIRAAEMRLGVRLPEDVKTVFRSFSGISHETPYFMGGRFETLRSKIAAAGCLAADDSGFQDDLVIVQIKRLGEWGTADELYNPKEEYRRLPEAMAEEGGQAFYDGCTQETIDNPAFVYIGDSYAETLFANLIEGSEHYGAIYNLRPYYPHFFAYKIADSYTGLLDLIVQSLERQAA